MLLMHVCGILVSLAVTSCTTRHHHFWLGQVSIAVLWNVAVHLVCCSLHAEQQTDPGVHEQLPAYVQRVYNASFSSASILRASKLLCLGMQQLRNWSFLQLLLSLLCCSSLLSVYVRISPPPNTSCASIKAGSFFGEGNLELRVKRQFLLWPALDSSVPHDVCCHPLLLVNRNISLS